MPPQTLPAFVIECGHAAAQPGDRLGQFGALALQTGDAGFGFGSLALGHQINRADRVALARILVLQPRFIIFDEPTSGLDMSVQAMVLNLLLELRERLGLTYLFISHDLSVVERFCDRVAIKYLGRIVELAPTGKIFASPRHPYTRVLPAAIPRLAHEP